MKTVLRFIKDWTLPLAMITGSVFHAFFAQLSVIIPTLIFVMLLLTFSKLTPRKVRFSPLHAWLVGIQVVGSLAVYFALLPINTILAESALICALAPTATSAAVVTGMLGGSVATLTTYTLISNVVVAVIAPLIFSLIGQHATLSFFHSFSLISLKVLPLLVLPLILAWGILRYWPSLNRRIISLHGLTFYIWTLALIIVTAKTVSFVMDQENLDKTLGLEIAAMSLIICVLQFYIGKQLGKRYRKKLSGGQALGQKNTVLAIWMAQSFLNPLSSLGPAAYVLWQNSFNAWQLYQRRKANRKEQA